MKKFVLVLFALSIVISSAVGQKKSIAIRSSEKVRQEQRDTRKRINKTKGEISENTAKTRKGLKQLGEIEADIAVRQEAINRAGARIAELNTQIVRLTDSLTQLESNISQLKTDYAQSLRAMRRQRQTLNSISYLFSAESFAQAFRRVRYIQELGRWRHDKTLKLGEAVAELNVRKTKIDSVRRRVADEQAAMLVAKSQFDKRRSEAAALVNELKKQGRSLNTELKRQQKQLNELNRELDRAIAAEVRRAEEERRRKAAEEERRRKAAEAESHKQQPDTDQAKNTESAPTAKPKPQKPQPSGESGFAEQERKLTGDFEANKGRLLFPVAGKYTITGAYGRYTRPGTSVLLDNNGIDISVPQGTAVRAVFGGEVVSVFKVKGTGFYAVLVRHGRYISVYSKLATYSVKNGQQVKAGQNLGTVFTDPELGATILHFELRRESATLNPLEWVK
jgi:septal ring factor EnvC (AmiA/AmiB activator)